VALLALLHPTQAAASAAPTVAPHILASAKEWFFRFQSGEIDRGQLDDQLNTELTTASVTKERATLRGYGTPTEFAFIGTERVPGATGYDFLISFRSGKVVEALAFDRAGTIVGIAFRTYAPKANLI
jgi:hypothetical protein